MKTLTREKQGKGERTTNKRDSHIIKHLMSIERRLGMYVADAESLEMEVVLADQLE